MYDRESTPSRWRIFYNVKVPLDMCLRLCESDKIHYLTDSDFSLEGEIATYNATAKRAPSLAIQKIIYSESVLRSAAYLFLGHAPISKIVFL